MVEKLVFIDCMTAGISGDMILGALVDLCPETLDLSELANIIKSNFNNVKKMELEVENVCRCEIAAKRIKMHLEENRKLTGDQLKEGLAKCIRELNLSKKMSSFATSTLDTLIGAELKVHGKISGEIELDELGSVDTVFDILGTAYLIQKLGLDEATFLSSPVSVGGGVVKFSHGIVSVPAPATLEILRSKGFPFIGKEVDAELTTPTGAAIIVNLAKKVMTIYPLIRIQKTGYGAGFRDFKEFPNITRIFVGEILERETMLEEILLIETNLDDVTGETLGYLMEKLFNEGAKDVCFIPVYAKKNRPAHIIRVMADEEKVEHLVKLLIKETGSLGVRIEKLHRYVLKREFVNLELPTELGQGIVRIKVAKDSDGKIINFKPEYEDVKLIAEKTGKPLKEVIEIVKQIFRRYYG
ncbi:MAG: nickel pincer cofactor biosynthesis protein LarC [Nitrososphaeria archaeon]